MSTIQIKYWQRTQYSISYPSAAAAQSDAEEEAGTDVLIPGEFCEVDLSQGDCFNIDACCDSAEKACIETLRAYLRPQEAPECLMTRLKACLDNLCDQSATHQ